MLCVQVIAWCLKNAWLLTFISWYFFLYRCFVIFVKIDTHNCISHNCISEDNLKHCVQYCSSALSYYFSFRLGLGNGMTSLTTSDKVQLEPWAKLLFTWSLWLNVKCGIWKISIFLWKNTGGGRLYDKHLEFGRFFS